MTTVGISDKRIVISTKNLKKLSPDQSMITWNPFSTKTSDMRLIMSGNVEKRQGKAAAFFSTYCFGFIVGRGLKLRKKTTKMDEVIDPIVTPKTYFDDIGGLRSIDNHTNSNLGFNFGFSEKNYFNKIRFRKK